MTLRTTVALGTSQCVNWGVLYYAFGPLLLPMQRDLDAPPPVVAGAFSVGLLVAAFAAPIVGRRCDAGQGPRLLRTGAVAAALLLWVLALVPHVATLYVVWAGLGLCMAAALYEPAFAIVGRSVANPRDRLRALSVVTVFGGLASTVFVPLTAFLLERASWRWTVATLGLFMAASAGIAAALRVPDRQASVSRTPDAPREVARRAAAPRLRAAMTMFAFASFAGAAFTATAVTAFEDRGLTATHAALIVGAFGVMQLPGRIILMTGLLENPSWLAVVSLALQAAGLAMLVVAPPPLIVAGVALFAIGNGVLTLVRPHLVHTTFDIAHAGAQNGAIARVQQLARAAGPFGAVLIASALGYRAMFAMLAAGLTALAASWWLAALDDFRNWRLGCPPSPYGLRRDIAP
jgi:predicted MFS family arabinose efflux permease